LRALTALAPCNAQLDAAAWVDIQPIIPNMMTLQDMTVNLYGFTTPPVPAACAAQYQGQDAWCVASQQPRGCGSGAHARRPALWSQEVHVAVIPAAFRDDQLLLERGAV
jgi:hypothetical protein